MKATSYVVYLLRCSDNTLYCGITTDIERRLNEHNGLIKNKGAHYTRARLPVNCVYKQSFPNRSEASKEEACIKSLTREQKEKLIESSIQ